MENKKNFNLPYDFPLRVYETDLLKKPLGYNGWHWHDEIQICVVKEGKVKQIAGKKEYVLEKGQGLVINKGIVHMSRPIGKERAIYTCMNADAALIYGFKGSLIERKYFAENSFDSVKLSDEEKWQKDILTDFERLVYSLEGGNELEAVSILLSIWNTILINTGGLNENSRPVSYHVKDILGYIKEHFDEKITLEDIAGEVLLEKSSCCRLFKKELGLTIWEYISEYRVRKSLNLLKSTQKTVSQIAYECGFNSTSYYIKTFKKMMGKSPEKFRKCSND